jgi:hypothetical protein
VEVNSPAELAGLKEESDYLLGTTNQAFADTQVLFEELSKNIDKPVEFYVYNSETDEVRVALVMPSDDWGGEGLLGANIAHGYLHKLPAHCCHTTGSSLSQMQLQQISSSPNSEIIAGETTYLP